MLRSEAVDAVLPQWNALCDTFLALDSTASVKQSIDSLKEKGPNWRYRVARVILRTLFTDPCYGKFLRCSWSEAVEVTAEQLILNREYARKERIKSLSESLETRAGNSWTRPFGQMPCTACTAEKRVHKVLSMVPKNVPILLLGDDDLVSVELAQKGFSHVTAIDIDPEVLGEIEKIARKKSLQIRLFEHDLSKKPPSFLYDDYRLVMFDSEYSLEGVRLFLKAGLELSRHQAGTLFFMSLHLMSLFSDGIHRLEALLSRESLQIEEFLRGFNAYPTPRKLKGLIHLWNKLVVGSPQHLSGTQEVTFLHSDALLLKKK